MFAIELAVPFVIFVPARFRRIRMTGCGLLCLLQILIAATGNYGFFNLLAIVLYLSLLDDATIASLLRLGVSTAGMRRDARRPAPSWRRHARAGATVLLLGLSAVAMVREIRRPAPMPAGADTLLGNVAPFRSVNDYGLFRVMTTERLEIIVQGSADGSTWREYPFKWKPGDPTRAPGFVQPHMPRLDWQMWFAALDPRDNTHWLLPLAERLLANDPAALDLLDDNPFSETAPRFVRLMMYRYRFATSDETAGGAWWIRERLGPLTEPLTRRP